MASDVFDCLTLGTSPGERDLEQGLLAHIETEAPRGPDHLGFGPQPALLELRRPLRATATTPP